VYRLPSLRYLRFPMRCSVTVETVHRIRIVWDVGACCGTVSVDSALFALGGHAYAIELESVDETFICEKAGRFGVGNVQPVLLSRAPKCGPSCLILYDDVPLGI